MSRPAVVPAILRRGPFRGCWAVSRGLVTRGQLANRCWQRLLPDVYLHGDADCDQLTWCRAVQLRLPPGAAFSCHTALDLYQVELLTQGEEPLHVTVPRPASMRPHPRLRIHERSLDAAEIRLVGGFPVTVPLRTALDLARDLDRDESVVALDTLLRRRLITLDQLDAHLLALGDRPGSRRLAAARALAHPLAESPMESRLRLSILRSGLPEPVVQHEVFDPPGVFVARLDLAYPWWRVGLEYDGDHHRERDVFRQDADRANRLHLAGWRVLRFTVDDLFRHPERLVSRIRAILPAGDPDVPSAITVIRHF